MTPWTSSKPKRTSLLRKWQVLSRSCYSCQWFKHRETISIPSITNTARSISNSSRAQTYSANRAHRSFAKIAALTRVTITWPPNSLTYSIARPSSMDSHLIWPIVLKTSSRARWLPSFPSNLSPIHRHSPLLWSSWCNRVIRRQSCLRCSTSSQLSLRSTSQHHRNKTRKCWHGLPLRAFWRSKCSMKLSRC